MDTNIFDIILERAFLPIYAITVMISLWRYPKYFDTILKYFPILLMYTFLNELLGTLVRYEEFEFVLSDIYRNNNWIIYNIYNIVFFLYFYYVFWNYVKNNVYRKVILYGSVLFVLASLVNPFFQSFTYESQVYAYLVGAVVLVISILCYFSFTHDTFDTWFRDRNLLSWLSLGMFIFYLMYIPIKIIRYQRALEQLNDIPLVRRTHLVLILVMYGCFVIGFWKMGRQRK